MTVNAQYNIARPESPAVKISKYQRSKIYKWFERFTCREPAGSILDVRATRDQSYNHSNYLEAWYPHKSRIIAVGIDNAEFLEALYPGVTFLRADGRCLPFEHDSFDFVHSSAVLEHVGSREQQAQFLREAWRVARKGIFIATPDRRFPIEFHTLLPIIHWLPKRLYRKFLIAIGYEFFADENNLNLMSRRGLAKTARAAGIERFEIRSVSLLALPTNLMLMAWKPT